jgi:gliding motility-associated-like protein
MKFIYAYFCIIFLSTPILSQVNLKNGLVACYPFNANAKDETGNGNNGTVNGATLTTDRFGKANSAYSFDGNSYIEISPDKLKTPTFSYSLWVKPSSIPVDGIAYFLFSVGSQSGDQAVGINNAYTNGADGFTGGGYLDVGENAFCQQGSLPNINQWYHVIVVRETNFYKTYVNGSLICTTSLLTKPPFYGIGNVEAAIGSRYNKGQFTQGSLDDIHLYNRPLNAAEVKALYDGNSAQTITITTNNSAPCGGDKITFIANGATNTAKYQWKVDGINQGTNSKTFDYTFVKKTGDYSVKITVEVTDDDPCFPQKPAATDQIIAIKDCAITPTGVNLKNGLVACYPFNGNAKDETGNVNNGTVNGATLTTDRFGKANSAYKFDGNSYISVSPNQFKNQSYSYATWVYLDNLPTSENEYALISVGWLTSDQNLLVTTPSTNFNRIANGFSCWGYNTGNPPISSNWTGTNPNKNKWYHVVSTRDNTSIKLYIDGILIADNSSKTITNGTTPIYSSNSYATIGGRQNSLNPTDYYELLKGSLDDIHLYNRAINAAEVKALYDGNTPQTITISASNSAPCGGDKITFTANGSTNTSKYQWKVDGINQGTNSKNFDYTSVKKMADYSVKITVEVTDDDPCFPQKPSIVDQNVTIKFCSTTVPTAGDKILIPNAFSPNGDGMNDTWEIASLAGNNEAIVEIYNRWGELIFYSKGYSEPWNGTYKDKPVLEGTYAYVVRVDSDTVLRGSILVVR